MVKWNIIHRFWVKGSPSGGKVKTHSLNHPTDKGVLKRLQEICWDKISNVIEIKGPMFVSKGLRVIAKKYLKTKFQNINYMKFCL